MGRKNKKTETSERDFLNPNQSLAQLLDLSLPRPAPVLLPVPTNSLDQVLESGDRRLYRPDENTRPPTTPTPGSSRVRAGPSFNSIQFAKPKQVAICVRRVSRREVLFALRKTRAGSKSKRHRNFWSDVSC